MVMDEMLKMKLATIIDCEGSIGIGKDHQKYDRPMVKVSQNEKWYVERFKEVFGFGSISRQNRDCWQYEACYIQALIICLTLVDVLELKKSNAELIINFYKKRLHSSNSRKHKTLITKMKRYNFVFDVRDLSRKVYK